MLFCNNSACYIFVVVVWSCKYLCKIIENFRLCYYYFIKLLVIFLLLCYLIYQRPRLQLQSCKITTASKLIFLKNKTSFLLEYKKKLIAIQKRNRSVKITNLMDGKEKGQRRNPSMEKLQWQQKSFVLTTYLPVKSSARYSTWRWNTSAISTYLHMCKYISVRAYMFYSCSNC